MSAHSLAVDAARRALNDAFSAFKKQPKNTALRATFVSADAAFQEALRVPLNSEERSALVAYRASRATVMAHPWRAGGKNSDAHWEAVDAAGGGRFEPPSTCALNTAHDTHHDENTGITTTI